MHDASSLNIHSNQGSKFHFVLVETAETFLFHRKPKQTLVESRNFNVFTETVQDTLKCTETLRNIGLFQHQIKESTIIFFI